MPLTHLGKTPQIARDAYIASNAMNCRIMFGAQVIAEGGSMEIGRDCIVMENAVLRAGDRHPLTIDSNCLIGPNAHVVGCRIEEEVFVATGAAIFHAAHTGRGSEVRVNAVVHVKMRLPAQTMAPIGWIAVGEPPELRRFVGMSGRPSHTFRPSRNETLWGA
jgi:carbonic anhydrase/acetyltransferase-like protein (isoleucine patch superfamily)